jgi:hypothetical protein
MSSRDDGDESLVNTMSLDFDLHGVLGIRVVNATGKDATSFALRFGYYQGPLDREADITIRFEDELAPPSMTYIGLNSTAFSKDRFYLLDKKDGKVVAQIPMDNIGKRCEIVFQSGIGIKDLLFEIIKFTLLSKGYIPIHASAFQYDGMGALVVGWKKGGKTEALVSFVNQGANYVGDEIVILSPDGETMFGLPIGVTLWDWQFKYIPRLVPKVSLERKILFRGIHLLESIDRRIHRGVLKRVFPSETLARAMPFLRRGLKISRSPQKLFTKRLCQGKVSVDKLFLIMSHSNPEIAVGSCSPSEVADRMASSNEFELSNFLQDYRAYKFAFPNVRNRFLDEISEKQGLLLRRALQGKEAYKVMHPYPVPLDQLFEQMLPYCVKSA